MSDTPILDSIHDAKYVDSLTVDPNTGRLFWEGREIVARTIVVNTFSKVWSLVLGIVAVLVSVGTITTALVNLNKETCWVKIGSCKADPKSPSKETPELVKYTFSTDSLFLFGKGDKTIGEAKLDNLVNKLKMINITSIDITGHTDRFGTDEFNQKLSESRAESMKTYLVGKGIQSALINVQGKGKTQPVTSRGDCKGPPTPEVVACLQPDRRVEIELVGTSKVTATN